MNRYFDTHTHYNDPRFAGDLQEVLQGIRAVNVMGTAVIGYDLSSSIRGLQLAEGSLPETRGGDLRGRPETQGGDLREQPREEAYARCVAAVGVHPLHVPDADEDDLLRLEILAEDPKAAAIGEIGLDYARKEGRPPADRDLQQYFFRKQIRIARRAGLPVVIHSRDAAQDTAEILEQEKAAEVGGVIHCYSYSPEMAVRFLRLGFFLGIGGVVTYPGSKRLRETVRQVALEHLVLETDAPYLPPDGHRGERNDSRSLPLVAGEIARIKNISVEEVCRKTWENACKLYRIPEEA